MGHIALNCPIQALYYGSTDNVAHLLAAVHDVETEMEPEFERANVTRRGFVNGLAADDIILWQTDFGFVVCQGGLGHILVSEVGRHTVFVKKMPSSSTANVRGNKIQCTVWCNEIGSLTSLMHVIHVHQSYNYVREPISLHQAVHKRYIIIHLHFFGFLF